MEGNPDKLELSGPPGETSREPIQCKVQVCLNHKTQPASNCLALVAATKLSPKAKRLRSEAEQAMS